MPKVIDLTGRTSWNHEIRENLPINSGTLSGQSYEIMIRRGAGKALSAIPARYRERIKEAITALGNQPRPLGCRKLTDHGLYRIRVAD